MQNNLAHSVTDYGIGVMVSPSSEYCRQTPTYLQLVTHIQKYRMCC